MKTITNCTGCPCMNSDYDYGESCNLAYNVIARSDMRKGKKNIPKGWGCFSDNCKLVKIVTQDEEWTPEKEEVNETNI